MAASDVIDLRRNGRRFFLLTALVFPLVMLAGFGRTYYLKGLFDSPPVPSMLVHVHGLLMAAWIVLFVVQVGLVSASRVTTHRRLGMFGVGLGAVMIPVGILTAVAAAKYGSAATPPNIPPLTFLVVPVFDMLMFAGLFGAAVYYRRQPANHKRLILLTTLNFFPPAIARLPLAFIAAAGPLAFFGIPDLLAMACVGVDARKNGKVNVAFLVGTILFIASHPVRLLLGGTAVWLRFAGWLAG